MGDEQLFLRANEEFESGDRQEALWVKALAQTGGNEEKAKHQYILLRVEQIKNNPVPLAVKYSKLYYYPLVFGLAIVFYIYLFNFDSYSETTLVRLTPFWFIPIVFGYYGLVSQRMSAKIRGTSYNTIADLLLAEILTSTNPLTKPLSLLVHAPFIAVKSRNPLIVVFGASMIWLVLLLVFFEAIFPML